MKLPNSVYYVVLLLIIVAIAYKYASSTFAIKATAEYPVPVNKKKALTWIIHMYPPYHNAGAEWMAHCLNRYLVAEQNYTIYVFIPSKSLLGIKYFDPTTIYEGVHVYDMHNTHALQHAIKHSAAICSHLDYSVEAHEIAGYAKKPYIHFAHNSFEMDKLRKWADGHSTYLVANSEWIKDFYSPLRLPTITLYPPVFWKDYAIETPQPAQRKYITLVNLNENKGGNILPQIAAALPQYDFAGVRGGYDAQIEKYQPNIKYFPNTPAIKTIYAQTRILLIPSKYESWGRVAVEAMSSGIPVIAHPTAGLRECLGGAGILCDRNDIASWTAAIKRLCEDPAYYARISDSCSKRARELDPIPQMNTFAEFVETL